jgi:hypothetical protein
MKSGQTFLFVGLPHTIKREPGDVGGTALSAEVELIVMVTPRLVRPAD